MLAAVLILLLSACDSGSDQATPQEPTASSSSPAPTATVPTMPAQAAEDSSEGAAAFVKYYVDVFNYAAATGDVDELSRLSSPDCDGCQRYIDLYRDTYEAGGYFKGADWTLGDLKLQVTDSATFVTTTAATEPGPYKTSDRGSESVSTGQDNEISFAVQRPSDAWQVTQFGLGGVS